MNHVYGFNALRAFSVMLVILSHIGIIRATSSPILKNFFSVFNANYGVKTFFVLSGFLITTLLVVEHKKTGSVGVKNFMARRALRILPLYFLILAVLVILILAGIAQASWTAMAFGTFFVFNFIPKGESVNYLSHLWSLAVEEQFYLVWPFLFAIFYGKRGVLVGICVAFILACYFNWNSPWAAFSDKFYTNRWTIPAIYPISIGALLALTVERGAKWLKTYPTLVISMALIVMPLFQKITASIEMLGTFGIAGLISWIFLNQENRVVRALDWGPIGYIGVISYGLYMWQGILTGNGPYRPVAGWPPEPMIGAILTFIVAPISFHFFEKPISNLRKKFHRSKIENTVANEHQKEFSAQSIDNAKN